MSPPAAAHAGAAGRRQPGGGRRSSHRTAGPARGPSRRRARRGAVGDRARPRPLPAAAQRRRPPPASRHPSIPPALRSSRAGTAPRRCQRPLQNRTHEMRTTTGIPRRTLPAVLAALGHPGCRRSAPRSRSRGASLLRPQPHQPAERAPRDRGHRRSSPSPTGTAASQWPPAPRRGGGTA